MQVSKFLVENFIYFTYTFRRACIPIELCCSCPIIVKFSRANDVGKIKCGCPPNAKAVCWLQKGWGVS